MNWPGFAGVVILVVLVVSAGIGLPIVGATGGDPMATTAVTDRSEQATLTDPVTLQAQEFDSTTFEVTVYENGSATWTFRHEQRLADSDEQDAFETFADEFESEDTDVYDRFQGQAQALTDTGSDVTDREMDAHSFERSAWVEEQLNPVGIVEMSFTWDGFAAVEDGSVIVGDVFRNLYITSDQSIEIRAGGDLTFEDVSPEPTQFDSDSLDTATTVTWTGEHEFLDGQPRIVFDDPAVASGSSGGSLAWLIGVALIILGLAGIAVWYRRSDRTGGAVDTAETEPPADTDTADEPPQPAGGNETDELTDETLLTDEDRVTRLIRENGGRMKQVNIVEETGWSKSKVSMLLSDMEEDGTISKLRVGRENIISLEGFEPEAAKSPFEE